MVCEVVLWCSVCSEVVLRCSACDMLWCSACARKQGPWGPLPPFYCHRGALPPLPPSPLFCMMYKSINGGGSGGGSAIHHPKTSQSGPQPIDTLIYLYPPHL